MALEFFMKEDIKSTFSRTNELLSSGIFAPQNSGNLLFKSAFIELLICMRDLMYKSEKFVSRISFEDDITKTAQIRDVTDLIKFVRDALCHPESEHHFLRPGIKATFLVAYGKGNVMLIGDLEIKSDYEDDVDFFIGEQKIYFRRHILRALEEARSKPTPLITA